MTTRKEGTLEKHMVTPEEIAEEVFRKTRPGILLTTKVADKVNTMVIGWGHLGTIWNRRVFVAYVRSSRFTFELLAKNPEFCVSVPREEHLTPGILRVAGHESGRNEDKIAKQQAKTCAIIYSMTRMERRNPDILNASRKRRIAAGSGTTVQEVNLLLKQFEQTRQMMKEVMGGGKRGRLRMPFKGAR